MSEPIRIAIAFQNWQRYSEGPVIGAAKFGQEHGGIELVDVQFKADSDVPKEINRIRPDGVITQIAGLVADAIGPEFFEMLPVVNVGWDLFPRGVTSVSTDLRGVVRVAHAHLKEAGYADVAIMFDTKSAGAEAFVQEYCAETGAKESDLLIHWGTWPGDDQAHDPGPNEELQKWLAQLPKPVGIIVGHGYYALWITQECERLEIKVPDEVGIIARLDENVCLFAKPAITSVRLSGPELGYEAIRLLWGLLKDPTRSPELVSVQPEGVIQRGSTGQISHEGEEISRALRYIERYATSGIQVDEVLRQTQTMSRSKFYSLFVHRIGRSPAEEIRRVRIEKGKQHLVTTRLSVTQIASLCGFNRVKQFSETFKKETGTTPLAFRKANKL
jgi:LacI family transcriptional regulator